MLRLILSDIDLSILFRLRTVSKFYSQFIYQCVTKLDTQYSSPGQKKFFEFYCNDEVIKKFSNLKSIRITRALFHNMKDFIADDGRVKSMNYSKILTDRGIPYVTNLTSLDLGCLNLITDMGIAQLKNLKYLDLTDNKIITDLGLQHLTSLTNLYLNGNTNISDISIKKLINLSTLSYCRRFHFSSSRISDEGIGHLTNLTYLDISGRNELITDDGLRNLTNITSLNLTENKTISDNGLMNLCNIKILQVYNNRKITIEGLKCLTNLEGIIPMNFKGFKI
jgi:Leucine-rich repeat (LRR) protein